MSLPPRFRAIIVGGGPAGLCLAHALSQAGIDYVLLERRETVVEESGLGLALWPHSVRILDQLGLLEEGHKIYLPVREKYNLQPDGSEITHNNLYDDIEMNHGHPWMLFRRQHLLDLLYKSLPENQTRILTKKKVTSIETHSKGVKVHCDDGSIEEGSITIGCDGVYSPVRGIMRDLALKSSVKMPDSETPMLAHYQLLAGHVHRIQHLPPGRLWEVRDHGLSMQVFMLEEEGWFLVYRRLPKPANQYTRYSDEDAQAFAKDIMDHPITKEFKFKDLWEVRKWTTMVNVEEGIIQRWHWDRIVLLGDSVHKMTPNIGLSLNQGWQAVAALTNLLRRLLSTDPDPDTESLTKVFEAYQRKTEKMAKDSLRLSNLYTRVTSWHNIAYKLADYVGPYLGGDSLLFKMVASPIVKQGIILDFLPERGHKIGRVKWVNKPQEVEKDMVVE